MSVTAIIAAMERELAPLVGKWQARSFSHNGRSFRVYEHGDLAAVAGGIGPGAAAVVARAMVEQYRPHVLISAGLAGALVPGLRVGSVFVPDLVIDSASGSEYTCDVGSGILVTTAEIAGTASKRVLAEKFRASAVDMEAAAIADVARQERKNFRCVKAISDEADFVMPPLNRFVDREGRFKTAQFVGWAAIHPRQWPRILTLARNTDQAIRALCDYLTSLAK